VGGSEAGSRRTCSAGRPPGLRRQQRHRRSAGIASGIIVEFLVAAGVRLRRKRRVRREKADSGFGVAWETGAEEAPEAQIGPDRRPGCVLDLNAGGDSVRADDRERRAADSGPSRYSTPRVDQLLSRREGSRLWDAAGGAAGRREPWAGCGARSARR